MTLETSPPARGTRLPHTLVPPASGLFDPKREYDACGVGFIATSRASPRTPDLKDALYISRTSSIAARWGADPIAGDGAGILIQIPTRSSPRNARLKIKLPKPSHYAWASCSCRRTSACARTASAVTRIIREEASIPGAGARAGRQLCLSEMVRRWSRCTGRSSSGRPRR